MTIFCLALLPKNLLLYKLWKSITLKPCRIGQNRPQKHLIWVESYWSLNVLAEKNSGENIIVTQSWQ